MPFSYSGPLCETLALGNVAYRVGTKLKWDPARMKAFVQAVRSVEDSVPTVEESE